MRCANFRIKDQESEIAQLKAENEMIRKQALPQRLSSASAPVSQVISICIQYL